jgi:hypothetical protein
MSKNQRSSKCWLQSLAQKPDVFSLSAIQILEAGSTGENEQRYENE